MSDALIAFSVDHDVLPSGSGSMLTVHGDLDLATFPGLEASVFELGAEPSTLVIDLSDVRFMDSTGLRCLWNIRQRLSLGGSRVLLRAPSVAVQRVLETTRLDAVFEFAD